MQVKYTQPSVTVTWLTGARTVLYLGLGLDEQIIRI